MGRQSAAHAAFELVAAARGGGLGTQEQVALLKSEIGKAIEAVETLGQVVKMKSAGA